MSSLFRPVETGCDPNYPLAVPVPASKTFPLTPCEGEKLILFVDNAARI